MLQKKIKDKILETYRDILKDNQLERIDIKLKINNEASIEASFSRMQEKKYKDCISAALYIHKDGQDMKGTCWLVIPNERDVDEFKEFINCCIEAVAIKYLNDEIKFIEDTYLA